jgi:predicted nucleotide-binding protein
VARRPTPEKRSVQLTREEIERAIPRIRKRIDEIEAFDPAGKEPEREAMVIHLTASIADTLARTFGSETVEYDRYINASYFHHTHIMGGTPEHYIVEGYSDSKVRSLSLLRQIVVSLEEQLEEMGLAMTPTPPPVQADTSHTQNRRIFVVHGHDEASKLSVERFLKVLSFEPIVLHAQPNKGATVIEKFESNADVGFAVVVLTPDDVGGVSADALQGRARQNVVLELGYFTGRLGRNRVAALKRGDLELPSDVVGVVYIDFDERGAWKLDLARELEAAEFQVDWSQFKGA